MFTTATDLTKWLDDFRNPLVGDGPAIARLLEEGMLSDGKKIEYALGLRIGKHRGLTTISHTGGDAGFRSYVCWYPNQLFGVAIRSNLGSFKPLEIAEKVAAVYLDNRMSPELPAVTHSFIELDPAVLKPFAGTYPLPQVDQTLVVVAEESKLLAAGLIQPPIEMKTVSPSSFYVESHASVLDFAPAPNGGMKVKITSPKAVLEGVRTVDPLKATADFQPYEGTYWSEELETQYTFSIKGGKLIAIQSHQGLIALTPKAMDSFSTDYRSLP